MPHYSAKNIEGEALSAVSKARASYYSKVNEKKEFTQSVFKRKVEKALKNENTDWLEFWEIALIELHGLDTKNIPDFEALSRWLENKKIRTITVIDGLEELFSKVESIPAEASAIDGLLDVPNRLREVSNSSIGVIILVREDYIEAVSQQNLGQLKERYLPYQLVWDASAFLRLVYWTCQQATLSFATDNVEILNDREVSAHLHSLWGLKLGKNDSREAYSVRWVYAALCDLRGRLQARDIIRFIKYSSEKAPEAIKDTWSDRVLPPQEVRAAMEACSKEKVKEAEQEFAVLGKWIKALDDIPPKHKQIPFASKDAGLDSEQLKTLIEIGIIYEDKKTGGNSRYYLPEAYRKGLNFTMAGGGRPKVQAMLKDSLGKLPVDI